MALPLTVLLIVTTLLSVALATAHRDGSPSGVGWACFAVLVIGGLWIGRTF